jgi:hypothetical protein
MKRGSSSSSSGGGNKSDIPFVRGFRLRTESEKRAALGCIAGAVAGVNDKDEFGKKWLSFADFEPIPRPTTVDDWLAQYREELPDSSVFY